MTRHAHQLVGSHLSVDRVKLDVLKGAWRPDFHPGRETWPAHVIQEVIALNDRGASPLRTSSCPRWR